MREDWVEYELGNVHTIAYGKGLAVKNLKKDGYPVFGANGIIGYYSEYKYEEKQVLISCRGAASGTINISPAKCFITNNSLVIETDAIPLINKDFLYYILRGANRSKIITGSAQPQVTINNANTLIIKLTSTSIQRTIVSKIEALFSDLDNGIADLKKAQEQLKIYRQAVLKKAFESSIVISANKDKLINISSKIGSGSTPKGGKSSYSDTGIPLVRSMNIHFDFIKYDGLAFINELQAEKLKNVIINEGDVLLNITGASIGRVNIAPKQFHGGRVNQHVSIIRSKNNIFVSQYLKYFLQSPDVQDWISNANYGVTRPALTKSMLESLEIPLLKYKEQQQIVRKIESRLSVCNKLEESIIESLKKSEALRQSILKKAFEGKLLSEAEIEKCKQAKDYEPASELLKKIKAGKK